MTFDPYRALGVSRLASSTTIQRAFVKLAKTEHPDKGGDPDEFAKISRARDILLNSRRRQRYDRDGVIDEQSEENVMTAPIGVFVTILAGMIAQHVEGQGGNPLQVNLVAEMQKAIQHHIGEFKKGRLKIQRAIKVYEAVHKRWKPKKKVAANPVLVACLAAQVGQLTRSLEALDQNIAAHQMAAQMLEDYTFDPETAVYGFTMSSTA